MPVTIDELTVADEPGAWAALGFEVEDRVCELGAVRVRLTGPGGKGLVAWSLRGNRDGGSRRAADDLVGSPPAEWRCDPCQRIVGLDHVVAITPSLDRTVATLEAAGLDLRRIREEPTPAGAPSSGASP